MNYHTDDLLINITQGVLELSNDLDLYSTEYLRSNATYTGDDDNFSGNADVFFIVFGVCAFVVFALYIDIGEKEPKPE